MKNSIEILRSGSFSSIQDIKRKNSRVYGIPRSGPMDKRSHILSNWLLGKNSCEETIEMTLIGSKLKFHFDTKISLCGAKSECFLNNRTIPMNQVLSVEKGDVIDIRKIIHGNWLYLSVSGKIISDSYFDSISTYEKVEIGGNNGRKLSNGDYLKFKPLKTINNRKVPKELINNFNEKIIRVIKGPEHKLLESKIDYFTENPFTVSPTSDRMGIRLKKVGKSIDFDISIKSSPVVEGTIQVPPDGNPIVLMSDSQTTGGYPRLGVISSVDISKFSQIKPNEIIRFRFISLEESIALIDYDFKKVKSRIGIDLVS
jgi:antagonist of KipI